MPNLRTKCHRGGYFIISFYALLDLNVDLNGLRGRFIINPQICVEIRKFLTTTAKKNEREISQ